MNLAFLLHIYQPPIQYESMLKSIAQTSYLPLIKSFKNKSSIKITLNMPLSLTYQLKACGYGDLIKTIKELFEAERIELTSSAAYHPLLTKLPEKFVEQEIILNEYGLGYYFGKDKGFDGEDALLIKNVNGFFPPEMAINQKLVKILDNMGYAWVIADDPAIPEGVRKEGDYSVYRYDDMNIKVVRRNSILSNMLSFKRDSNINDIMDAILNLRQEGKDAVIALDGEFFGHHYTEGVYLFDMLIEALESVGVNIVTVSELVEKADEMTIKEVEESTWGANSLDIQSGNKYPFWETPGNKIHKLLWELFNKVTTTAGVENQAPITIKHPDLPLETLPIWDFDSLTKINDINLKNNLFKEILLLQTLNSDQFWWSSNAEIGGKKLFHKGYIEDALDLYGKYAEVSQNKELKKFVDEKSSEIKALI